MEKHLDRAKFLMSEERKQWHNPEPILKCAGAAKGMTMADLGSGPGFFTIPMAQMTGEKGLVYAVESNESMLESLKENISKSEANPRVIKIIKNDVCHTGIPKESVDLVLLANILHEVDDRKTFFQEVKRISKLTAQIVDLDWKKIKTEHGPPLESRLSEDEAKQILSESGFTIVKQINAGPYHYELICKLTVRS
ncbi:MAG TPA: class I SAM-dependent methyltransferase [Candidatus Bathyarchaeia archaeon]|nr:class I SAM-dependent methyltransferase [Candidatus Bathyarchaeia archaeon]